jgi:hypothetical protein
LLGHRTGFGYVSAVNIRYSDCCCLTVQKGGAETGIKDYQYNYLSDNFKVVVMNFKSIRGKGRPGSGEAPTNSPGNVLEQ